MSSFKWFELIGYKNPATFLMLSNWFPSEKAGIEVQSCSFPFTTDEKY